MMVFSYLIRCRNCLYYVNASALLYSFVAIEGKVFHNNNKITFGLYLIFWNIYALYHTGSNFIIYYLN